VAVIFGMLTAMAAYVLLKHVNENAARAVVIFIAAAAAMMGLNMVHQFGALLVATDPTYANAFGAGGTDALVLLQFELHRHGYLTAQIFFGLWLLPLGYLVYKSGMFPRALGVLLMAGCFGTSWTCSHSSWFPTSQPCSRRSSSPRPWSPRFR
jgi:hypothetical protein